jgi:hypothetical protein
MSDDEVCRAMLSLCPLRQWLKAAPETLNLPGFTEILADMGDFFMSGF